MIPENITREHLIKAIEEINEKGIKKGRHSSTYDLIFDEKRYPPKLVISIANRFANGKELDHNTFNGGVGTDAFKKLESAGFVIEQKLGNKMENYDSGVFTKAMDISIEIDKQGLTKVAPKVGTPESDAYHLIKQEKIEVYKDIYKKSPNLVLKDILTAIYEDNNLDSKFEVKNFKYWGRVVQRYVWACISLKGDAKVSNPQSNSPQLYILIDHELVRIGLCYGDYL